MNTEQQNKVLARVEQMVENEAEIIKLYEALPEKDKAEFTERVQQSAKETSELINKEIKPLK